ncbi:ras-related protein Rab-32-like [Tigriopus californicus]|uniref:ras-related protein Rab-32-like n=1 Tax=Tigriopus californicus TaxID=6832 RepID=UPI0027DAB3A8|nr:ras-related protein Rab-32-like [Tigriopus californicus]
MDDGTPIKTSLSGVAAANGSVKRAKSEYLYKILVIGELGTGKTSFIKRYVHNFFSENYRATIGVDFALKMISWDDSTVIRLQLWDIAGQERFSSMTRVYYRDSVGAFILFDTTRAESFQCVNKWKQDLDSKVTLPDGRPIPVVLVGNKSDQPRSDNISQEAIDTLVRQKGFVDYFEASAKDNVNVEESANALIQKILDNERWKKHHHQIGDELDGQEGSTLGPRITMSPETRSSDHWKPKKGSDCSC